MKPFLAILILLNFAFAQAASLTTNEVFVRLQSAIETGKGFDVLVGDLEEIETPELSALLKEFDRTWPQLRDKYFKAYQEFAETQFTGSAKTEATRQIRKHREDFMKVYQLGEGPMKPLLKTTSMPAMIELKKLIMPSVQEIFGTAPTALESQRKITLILAKFRDAIVNTAVLPDQEAALDTILTTEKQTIAALGGLPRDGLRIIQQNNKIAENEKIPASEREGIREANEWRLLLGLNALIIDPKLCDASRGHSEDMNKEGFFAHDSPVPGKTTPWDRASKAGTKARGENIYMGSPVPANANKGWFYSPGHHKNMFKASHKTIGLGQYQKHWTQMFG